MDLRRTEEPISYRSDQINMNYYVDGMRIENTGSIHPLSIARVTIYSNGLPAKYGDTLQGSSIIEYKSYFDLYRNWEIQQWISGRGI